jgi:hypothetical protein
VYEDTATREGSDLQLWTKWGRGGAVKERKKKKKKKQALSTVKFSKSLGSRSFVEKHYA